MCYYIIGSVPKSRMLTFCIYIHNFIKKYTMTIVNIRSYREEQKIKFKAQKRNFFLYQERTIFPKMFQGFIVSLERVKSEINIEIFHRYSVLYFSFCVHFLFARSLRCGPYFLKFFLNHVPAHENSKLLCLIDMSVIYCRFRILLPAKSVLETCFCFQIISLNFFQATYSFKIF